MRVLILSPFGTAVNPYIGLFAAGLQAAGAEVQAVRMLDQAQVTASVRPDVIHLHWVERYDLPAALKILL